MQYLGGKSRIARELARQIVRRCPELTRPQDPVELWEPFCGGLGCTSAFARWGVRKILCSDVHVPLIAMHRAFASGWRPPGYVTKQQWEDARSLPDQDPMKAFCGFGCSFGGMWFSTYAVGSVWGRSTGVRGNYAGRAVRNMAKIFAGLEEKARFENLNFLDIEAGLPTRVIYCDPPYRGTAEYSTGSFDHSRFWERCFAWAASGSRVFVSEYEAPEGVREIWRTNRATSLNNNHATRQETHHVEKLWEVGRHPEGR